MSSPPSPTLDTSQTILAATILISYISTYIALLPPNPNPNPKTSPRPRTGDSISALGLTRPLPMQLSVLPCGLLTLHTAWLAATYPDAVPSWIIRYGWANGINRDSFTWSTATVVPMIMILCVGVPLRLIAYGHLGSEFTFALAEPGKLNTQGIYRHLQHPGYASLAVLVVGNIALVGRVDGVLACWVKPEWFPFAEGLWWWVLFPVGLMVVSLGFWTRVRQEEGMLRGKFGREWEVWHARTPRFVPGVTAL